jgi:hypothetical protein
VTTGSGTDDVIVLEANAGKANAVTVKDFEEGGSGDDLDISFALVDGAGGAVNLAGTAGSNDVAAGNFGAGHAFATGGANIVIFETASAAVSVTAQTETAAHAALTSAGATIDASQEVLAIIYGSGDAAGTAGVYMIDNDGDTAIATTEVKLVAILEDVVADSLVAGDFI